MGTRKPTVAGQFYPADRSGCLREIEEALEARQVIEGPEGDIVAGIVPHAGWMFSGDLACLVFSTIKKVHKGADTFVIFGAAHRYFGSGAAVYGAGKWMTPLGEVEVDEELAGEVSQLESATVEESAHRYEHSIEVQVPFVQHLFPEAKIVPVVVGPGENNVKFGSDIGELILKQIDKKIVCIASTDLTHYGPRYGFCPAGSGDVGIKWAKEVNDAEFISLALSMKAGELLRGSVDKQNACGPGAVAVVVEAAKKMGKRSGRLLAHTTSSEVMLRRFNQSSEESVGYAAIIY